MKVNHSTIFVVIWTIFAVIRRGSATLGGNYQAGRFSECVLVGARAGVRPVGRWCVGQSVARAGPGVCAGHGDGLGLV